jgi:hypothetical protein
MISFWIANRYGDAPRKNHTAAVPLPIAVGIPLSLALDGISSTNSRVKGCNS